MILVDTNVIIGFWRKPTPKAENIFLSEEVVICGVVKAELIHGAKSKNDIAKINEALSVFEYISISDSVWNALGPLLYQLRTNGITVPFQDALISALSIQEDLSIWSNDKHFEMIQKFLPDLKLFTLP